jgi:ACS family tartrate transporter-like MFS transporter
MPSSILAGSGAAAGIALINSIGNLGGLIGPALIGRVLKATGGFTGGLLVVAAAMAFAGVLSCLVRMQPVRSNT